MKSSGCCGRKDSGCSGCRSCHKRSPLPRRVALNKSFAGSTYRPQFALGVMCRDEADQASLHGCLRGLLAGREIKVLVI